jgi:hypothetical protein
LLKSSKSKSEEVQEEMLEGEGKVGKGGNNGGMADSWVFTDGEEVDGDWDECKDAVAMLERQNEREGRATFNERVRDILLGLGGRGVERGA